MGRSTWLNHLPGKVALHWSAMYGFMLWLIPAMEKFPRTQKFLPGDRIQ